LITINLFKRCLLVLKSIYYIDKIDFEINWNSYKISPQNQPIFDKKKSKKTFIFGGQKKQINAALRV